MARPQTIYSYLPDHNQIADEFIELLNKKISEFQEKLKNDKFKDFILELDDDGRLKLGDVSFDNKVYEKENTMRLKYIKYKNKYLKYKQNIKK
jgi:hypothetical protein